MTIATLVARLGELASFLDAFRQGAEAKSVRAIQDFLRPHSEAKTPQFLKKARPTAEVGSSWAGTRVGAVVPILDAYLAMIENPAPKTAKEFVLLIDFLRPHDAADLDEFLKAAGEAAVAVPATRSRRTPASAANLAVVDDYVRRLKSVLGGRGFDDVFESLKDDTAARKQEVAEIAKRMMPAPPSGMDRKKALKAIEDLHRSASGFDLKLKASGGRSAA